MDIHREDDLSARAAQIAPDWEQAVHGLRDHPHVIDIRNIGMVAGIELEPRPDQPAARAYEVFLKCYEKGLLIRTTGDIIALSPPLIIARSEIDQLVTIIGESLREVA